MPSIFGASGWGGFSGSAPSWARPASGSTPATNSRTATGPTADTNPFETVSNIKVPDVDSRLTDLFRQFDTLNSTSQRGVDAYNTELARTMPAANAFATEDTNYLSRILGGGTAADLAGIRQRRRTAVAQSVDQAQRELRRTLGLASAGVVGGNAAPGTGSYLARLGLGQAAEINAKAALDEANQERMDYGFLTDAQRAAVGQRTPILNGLAQRNLLPNAANGDRINQLLTTLQALLQGRLGSNTYGLTNSLNDMAT
jgi:hypothetical protein